MDLVAKDVHTFSKFVSAWAPDSPIDVGCHMLDVNPDLHTLLFPVWLAGANYLFSADLMSPNP
eukprot:11935977-Karenia_brevis.AAC.1